jgi:catalase
MKSAVLPVFIGLLGVSIVAGAEQPLKAVQANDFIELFEKMSGSQPGHRRAHARGVCAVGRFFPAASDAFAGAQLLSGGELPAVMRFSVGGGQPQADERKPGTRGMGLRIQLPGGGYHVFTGNNFPVFAGKDPETFFGFLATLLPDENGEQHPEKTAAFVRSHPSVQANAAWQRSARAAASYANTGFYGLHTFYFQGESESTTKFRWQLVPDLGVAVLEAEEAAAKPAAFLEETLARQLAQGAVSFTLVASIGEAADSDIDPSVQWPEDRPRVTLGSVRLTASGGTECRDLNFDPNVLSAGFRPSDDPVLRLRSPAYAISFAKRLGEN